MNSHRPNKTNQATKFHNMIKLSTIALTVALTMACADRGIVVMESPVEQQKNLRDLDSDGVIEAREKCADTLLGATIDNYGCGKERAINETINLGLNFENDSSLIAAQDFVKIQKVAEFLKKFQDIQILVKGHTSKVGGREYNQMPHLNVRS